MSRPGTRTSLPSPAAVEGTAPLRRSHAEQLALELPMPDAMPDAGPPDPWGDVGDTRTPLQRGARPMHPERSQPAGRRAAHRASEARRSQARADGATPRRSSSTRRGSVDQPGAWRLDARTRQSGLRGIAAARRALNGAAGPDQAA